MVAVEDHLRHLSGKSLEPVRGEREELVSIALCRAGAGSADEQMADQYQWSRGVQGAHRGPGQHHLRDGERNPGGASRALEDQPVWRCSRPPGIRERDSRQGRETRRTGVWGEVGGSVFFKVLTILFKKKPPQ